MPRLENLRLHTHTKFMRLWSGLSLTFLAVLLASLGFAEEGPTPDPTKIPGQGGEKAYVSQGADSPFYTPAFSKAPAPAGDLKSFPTTGDPATDPQADTLDGCGAVDYESYSRALLNMPKEQQTFNENLNTLVARQLLTLNYALPQTSALFGQLNQYTTARFQQFQRACNLTDLQAKARQSYINQCVERQLPRSRAEVQTEAGRQNQAIQQASATPASTPDAPPLRGPAQITPEQQARMAVAHAHEVCAMQYTKVNEDLRKQSNTNLVKDIRTNENLTEALRPILCPADSGVTAGGTSPCWPLLLMPRVRLCALNELGCSGSYGIKDPLIQATHLLNAFRNVLRDDIQGTMLQQVDRTLRPMDDALLQMALNDASVALSTEAGWSSPTPQGLSLTGASLGLQQRLGCGDLQIGAALSRYLQEVGVRHQQSLGGQDAPPQFDPPPNFNLATLTFEPFRRETEEMVTGVTGNDALDQTDLGPALQVALACTLNAAVPMLDHNIAYGLTQCTPDDRRAFYTMSAEHAAMQATQELYHHTLILLREASPQLGRSATTTAQPPVIYDRFLEAQRQTIADVLIPSLEAQLESLEQLDKARQEFSQNAQRIHSERRGCMYGAAAQPSFE